MGKQKPEHRFKGVSRIMGNWGISFFSPLVSLNVAQSYFSIPISFEQTIIISFLSSLFVTGLSVSRELEKYGRAK